MAIFILIQPIPLPLDGGGWVVRKGGGIQRKGVMSRHWMVGEMVSGFSFMPIKNS
jgi:hypothetical protein